MPQMIYYFLLIQYNVWLSLDLREYSLYPKAQSSKSRLLILPTKVHSSQSQKQTPKNCSLQESSDFQSRCYLVPQLRFRSQSQYCCIDIKSSLFLLNKISQVQPFGKQRKEDLLLNQDVVLESKSQIPCIQIILQYLQRVLLMDSKMMLAESVNSDCYYCSYFVQNLILEIGSQNYYTEQILNQVVLDLIAIKWLNRCIYQQNNLDHQQKRQKDHYYQQEEISLHGSLIQMSVFPQIKNLFDDNNSFL